MIAKLKGSPVRSTDGDRTICVRKGIKSSSEFVYIAMSAVPMSKVLRQVPANKRTFTQGNFCCGASSSRISADESNALRMGQSILLLHLFSAGASILPAPYQACASPAASRQERSKRLQVLAGFETHGFSGRDIHFRTGPRVSADAGLTRLYREHAEAPQLNPIIGLERVLHAIEDGIHCLFCFGLAHSRTLNDLVYKIEFDHWSLRISFVDIFLTSGNMLGNGN